MDNPIDSIHSLFFEPPDHHSNILILPIELLFIILTYLEVWHLAALARVSHRMRKVVSKQGDLQKYRSLLKAPARTRYFLSGRMTAPMHPARSDRYDELITLQHRIASMELTREAIFVQPLVISTTWYPTPGGADLRIKLRIVSPHEDYVIIRFLAYPGKIDLWFGLTYDYFNNNPPHWYSVSGYILNRKRQYHVVLLAIEIARRFRCERIPYFPEMAPLELWRAELKAILSSEPECTIA